MFLIPCKFNWDNPHIFECVKAIRKHHPGEQIVVIDSDSEDKSYVNEIGSDVIVLDAKNRNYGTNAFFLGFQYNPNADYYYCIYDSLILQDNISYLEQYPVTAFRYFKSPPTGWGYDSSGVSLYHWASIQTQIAMGKFLIPFKFTGIMGPMFVASNQVMREMYGRGLFVIKPQDKYQLCAMERIYGIVLENLGYDFWTHAPQGEMFDFFGEYPEDKVRKINAARM